MRHVLLVEDDADVGGVICQMIEAAGFACRLVRDVAQARRILAREPVDILVTDVVLPGGAMGTEIIAEAKRRGIACLVISGYPDVIEAAQTLDAAFLAKPFRAAELTAAIFHAMNGRARTEAEQPKGNGSR